jgi:hypothetical protein
MKYCGKRSSNEIYSKKELEELAIQQLGWTKTKVRKTVKKDLCKALNIEWK